MKMFRAATACMFLSAVFLATATDTSAASRLAVLHPFTGPSADGTSPVAPLMRAADGNFYGTTQDGGTFDRGTIFRMTPAGVVSIMYSFAGGSDGNSPLGALIQASDGNFYGTTYFGGGFSLGTVFRMTPAGAVTIIHAFVSRTDGANPRAALLQASDGNLYGTTQFGGASDRGTLFGMNLAGTTFFRYSFSGAADGAYPYAPVIQARNGFLYGTVYAGDFSTHGRIFRMAGTTVSVVHTFTRTATDGANPLATLVEGADGNFYGTTHFGGAFDQGTAFRMTPAGVVTVIKSFSGGADGAFPDTALIQPRDGNFYGAAKVGALGYGTLYKMSPSGVVTVLHTFTGGDDGANPGAALIEATAGRLYGSTVNGGSGNGVLFRLTTTIAGATPGDFDGDGRADQTVFRPSSGTWLVHYSNGAAPAGFQFGSGTDVIEPGDYDGDGQTDLAVFRPGNGTWYIKYSGTGNTVGVQWGNSSDTPVPADYDGDGITDIAIFRPSSGTWYIVPSSTGSPVGFQWGNSSDVPLPGDYNGDGKADMAVFRPSTGTWFILFSGTGGAVGVQWGNSSDIAVPGDYDGDGKTDIAVFRPSTGIWFIVNSSTGSAMGVQWGNSSDKPVPADYDGDGKTDIAIFRPSNGTWYIVNSTTGGAVGIQWGNSSDTPILMRP